MYVLVYECAHRCLSRPEGGIRSPELELEAIVICPMRKLGTKLPSIARTPSAFKCIAISLFPRISKYGWYHQPFDATHGQDRIHGHGFWWIFPITFIHGMMKAKKQSTCPMGSSKHTCLILRRWLPFKWPLSFVSLTSGLLLVWSPEQQWCLLW